MDLILRGVILLAIILILRFLCTTRFAVRHSGIGRQIARFGDFNSIYPNICAAAQAPLYSNGTEVISKDYIFLMPEPDDTMQRTPFGNSPKLLILSVQELARISVKPNAPYPEEMNTLIFRTPPDLETGYETFHTSPSTKTGNKAFQSASPSANGNERLYTMTVHLDTMAAQELTLILTKQMQENSTNFPTQNHTIPPLPKSRRTLAERSFARFCANPLRELRAGKMRVFRFVVFSILLVNIGAMLFIYFITGNRTLSRLPHDFVGFIRRELLANPDQLLFLIGLLAFYLIPILLVYMCIQRWYHHFLEEYEKLPHIEQTELLEKLCDNFKTGQPAVIYTEHCFCFRNLRAFSFQTLLPYSSVLWIYRTHSAFALPSQIPGTKQQVEFYHLIIRTANHQKYRIASSNEPQLSQRAPEAILGYGDIQREAYLELARKKKE
ncbi:MAG: hypothetical protein K2N63_11590 [Lachnospiraceae bacterium]|nr:hypothetical protein [Lachnospiraceae bacterium]